jgi:hypothetical protein
MLLVVEIESLTEISVLCFGQREINLHPEGRKVVLFNSTRTAVIAYFTEENKDFCVLISQPIHWELIRSAKDKKRLTNVQILTIDLL